MKYPIDYCFHSHTYRCGHANVQEEELVKACIKAGFKCLNITDHTPLPNFPDPNIRMDMSQFDEYVSSVKHLKEKYKDQIKIRVGVEAEYSDELKDLYKSWLDNSVLDLIIIGQHGSYEGGTFYYRASQYEDYVQRGREYVANIKKAIDSKLIKYIAHPDFILNIMGEQYRKEALALCSELIDYSVKNNIILEINVQGAIHKQTIYEHGYPDIEFWKMVGKHKDAKVTIGMDIHNLAIFESDKYINDCYEIAKIAGINLINYDPFEEGNQNMKATDLKKEEQLKLIMGKSWGETNDLNGKLPSILFADGPIGLRAMDKNLNSLPGIAFPCAQALANSWDLDLANKLGEAIANECIDRNVDVILGPAVNIKRTPVCGRNFEYLSEDPLLAGMLAKSYIDGVESHHVGTCVKHFCCNSQEYSRRFISCEVEERALREIYLKPFAIAMESNPFSVMCSYNLLNGIEMNENRELFKILRNDLGFKGLLITDWNAVKVDSSKAIAAGMDVTMPYAPQIEKNNKAKLKAGKINLKSLEDRAQEVIDAVYKNDEQKALRKNTMYKKERRELAQIIEEESAVLLKNNNVLPLSKKAKVLITGDANNYYFHGGGSANVPPESPVISLEDAMNALGGKVEYVKSIQHFDGGTVVVEDIGKAVKLARTKNVSIVCVGNPALVECEGVDRDSIRLSPKQEELIKFIAQDARKTIVIVHAGSAIDMSNWIDSVDAVLWASFGGQNVNKAIAKILYGDVNPSGKLSETFPMHLEDVPSYNAPHDAFKIVYTEGLNVGYRYFSKHQDKVLFPFGYGLSYSKFEYTNYQIDIKDGEMIISFDVLNLGEYDGKEIPQIYIGNLSNHEEHPIRELKAFKKVFVPKGGSTRVTFNLTRNDLKYWSVTEHEFVFDKGEYDIQVGHSSQNIVFQRKVYLN